MLIENSKVTSDSTLSFFKEEIENAFPRDRIKIEILNPKTWDEIYDTTSTYMTLDEAKNIYGHLLSDAELEFLSK